MERPSSKKIIFIYFVLTVHYCNLLFLSVSLGYFPHPLPILGEQITRANLSQVKNRQGRTQTSVSSMQLQLSAPVYACYDLKSYHMLLWMAHC